MQPYDYRKKIKVKTLIKAFSFLDGGNNSYGCQSCQIGRN